MRLFHTAKAVRPLASDEFTYQKWEERKNLDASSTYRHAMGVDARMNGRGLGESVDNAVETRTAGL